MQQKHCSWPRWREPGQMLIPQAPVWSVAACWESGLGREGEGGAERERVREHGGYYCSKAPGTLISRDTQSILINLGFSLLCLPQHWLSPLWGRAVNPLPWKSQLRIIIQPVWCSGSLFHSTLVFFLPV